MTIRILLTIIFLCVGLAACIPALPIADNPALEQTPSPVQVNIPETLPIDYPTRSIQFSHLTGEDGISQSVIDCMLQDRYGYIWLGTEDGLNKFDGQNFIVFKNDPDDLNSLSHSSVTTMAEAPDGTLWIGTRGGGINLYSRATGKFTHIRSKLNDPQTISSDYIESIAIAADGVVWIGTNGGGLDRYDPVSRKFIRYQKNSASDSGISNNQILSLAIGSDGMVWVGTAYGLDIFDPTRELFTNYRFDDQIPYVISRSAIRSLLMDDPYLWVGTDAGLFQLDPVTRQVTEIPIKDAVPAADRIPILAIHRSSNGTIWAGTMDFGLFRISPDLTRVDQITSDPRDLTTLSDNRILSILEDRSGILWLGTYSGFVNQLDPLRNRFKNLGFSPWKENSLTESRVWAVAVGPDNDLWIGTDGGGLNRYNLANGEIQYFRHDPADENSLDDDHVRSLFVENDGDVWVGTNTGLNRMNRIDGTFTHFPLQKILEVEISEPNRSVPAARSIPVMVICKDKDNFYWIGTENSGLYRLNPNTGETKNIRYLEGFHSSLTSNTVSALYPDKDSILWIGTDRGMSRFDTKTNTLESFLPSPSNRGSLSDYRILSIHRSRDGVLWIGTGAGLNRFDEVHGLFTSYREKDGLPNDYIHSIQEDDSGRLWLSTNKGISRFDPSVETFTNFDQTDGLSGDEFNPGGGARARNGYLFFGGINGITFFHPDDIQPNSFIPDVRLTSLTQGGQPLQDGVPVEVIDSITLTWPKNYFEFTFQNQSSSRTGKYRYSYRLEPFETDWVITQKTGSGRYTNLPGGTFTLHIRSSNTDGGWNPGTAALRVTVIPPVWENRWFMLTIGLVLFGLIPIGILLRTRSVQKRNLELTELVHIRTREIDQRRQVAEGLRDILVRINSNQSIEDSLEFIACQIRNSVGADTVIITKSGDDSACDEDFFIKSSPEAMPDEIDRSDFREIYSLLLEKGKFLPEDFRSYLAGLSRKKDNRLPSLFKDGVAFQVILDDKVEAALLILMETTRNWSEEELDMFTSFSDQIALALGNARLRQKAADFAMLNERNRLARDLHDAVTQTLFSASLLAEAFPSVWENNPQEGKKLIQEMRQLTRGALAEMRSLLMELRPSAMAEAKLSDLLRQLAEAVVGRTGLEIKLEIDPGLNLSSELNITFYRIAQEALTNIVKHARATKVWIRCRHIQSDLMDAHGKGQTQITMEVEDNGCGFEPKTISPDRFGLYNIHERAESIGARVNIQSKPGCGTIVKVDWAGEEIPNNG